MKLLFLITALCPATRYKIKEDLHGIPYLTNILNLMLDGKSGLHLENENNNVLLVRVNLVFQKTDSQLMHF